VEAQGAWATCGLVGTQADPGITGIVQFYQSAHGAPVYVTISASGITQNVGIPHGIHVHEFGDLRDETGAALSVGGHYNFNGTAPHGCPEIDGDKRHTGDLGNWFVDSNGNIMDNKTVDLINLSGLDSIIGRSVVLHNFTDPCSNGTVYGSRLAFCVIGVQNTTALGTTNQAINDNALTAAFCSLKPTANSTVSGQVYFLYNATSGLTQVLANIQNITGARGFHVHTFGDLNADGMASGGHWNPTTKNHGIPPFSIRHVGDMGNIYFYNTDGSAWYSYFHDQLTLSGVNGVVGRTVIVHSLTDSCVPPTGNSGSRLAQCVIGLVNTTAFALPIPPATLTATQDPAACYAYYNVTQTQGQTATNNGNTIIPPAPTTPPPNGASSALLPAVFMVLVVLALYF